MRNTKTLLLVLTFILPVVWSTASAQNKKPDEVKRIVESKNYIFKAQAVLPQSGTTRQLTSDYDLTIAGDTLISYLPYFGRAYVAPSNPSEGGIKFTSTKFDYTARKSGDKWEIMIKPKDASDVQELYLDIFDNGRASLRITNLNRQPISFDGYVEAGKSNRKKAF